MLSDQELGAIGLAVGALVECARRLPANSPVAHELIVCARLLLDLAPDESAEVGGRAPELELADAEEKLRLLREGRFAVWEVLSDRTLRRVA
jgi:hypothetical protein